MPISVSVLVLAADAVANFIFMIPVFSEFGGRTERHCNQHGDVI